MGSRALAEIGGGGEWNCLERWINGERFRQDASNHPNENSILSLGWPDWPDNRTEWELIA